MVSETEKSFKTVKQNGLVYCVKIRSAVLEGEDGERQRRGAHL